MLKKIIEIGELSYLRIAVKGYEWLEQRRVRRLFYQDPQYRSLDQDLLRGLNPYKFEEAFPYGETPLSSLKQIADRCGLNKDDRVADLGCGRGRGVFFLAQQYGCHTSGIDKTRPFIQQAEKLKQKYQISNVQFSCTDMRKFDFRETTFVFFYGTTYDDKFVGQLSTAFQSLPKGAKIVTVSAPLEGFQTVDQFSVSFPWGKGDIYAHGV